MTRSSAEITANIYRIGEVETQDIQAAADSISELSEVAQHPIRVEGRMKIPNIGGAVDLRKIGYGKFDPDVDLHIMVSGHPIAAELSEQQASQYTCFGLSPFLSGLSLITARSINKLTSYEAQRNGTTHEIMHNMGFVAVDAVQTLSGDPAHCSDGSCIMAPTNSPDIGGLCTPCTADVRDLVSTNMDILAALRKNRGGVNALPVNADAVRRHYEVIGKFA